MTLEKTLDDKTSRYLSANNYQFFKVHGNGMQRSGIADFIAYRNGQLVMIENKHPDGTGRLKALQYVSLKAYADEGAVCIVSDDIEYTKEILHKCEPGLYIPEKYLKQALRGLAQCSTMPSNE